MQVVFFLFKLLIAQLNCSLESPSFRVVFGEQMPWQKSETVGKQWQTPSVLHCFYGLTLGVQYIYETPSLRFELERTA